MYLLRRQYAESWRKMQELRAQIQAQLKLADTLKKISEAAGQDMIDNLIFSFNSLTLSISFIIGFDDMNPLLGKCSASLIEFPLPSTRPHPFKLDYLSRNFVLVNKISNPILTEQQLNI